MSGMVVFALLLSASTLSGEVIFSNYDLTDPSPFNQPGFAIGQVGNPSQPPVNNYQWATPFSITAAAQVDTITLALAAFFAGGPAVTVELHGPGSIGGNPIPGAIFESWTVKALPVWTPTATAADVSITLISIVHAPLAPGQLYWVSAFAPNSPTAYAYDWYDYPNQVCCSPVAQRVDFAPTWSPVFSTAGTLEVTSVPEPSTAGFAALFLLASLAVHSLGRSWACKA